MELLQCLTVDVDIFLREIFTRIYYRKSDAGHTYWLEGLKAKSLLFNNINFSCSYLRVNTAVHTVQENMFKIV